MLARVALVMFGLCLALPAQAQDAPAAGGGSSPAASGSSTPAGGSSDCSGGSGSGSGSGSGGGGGDGSNASINKGLADLESNGGDYNAKNPTSGALGKYQFTPVALQETGYMNRVPGGGWGSGWTGKDGVNSASDFLANHQAQENAQNSLIASQMRQLQAQGATSYIGQTINGTTITQSGLISGAHLVGAGGVSDYLKSGGSCSGRALDASGTCVSKYLAKGANAGGGGGSSQSACQDNKNLDKTSKTCKTTMPMIKAIDCNNFPAGQVQQFCQENKPYLMTDDDCDKAEKYAQGATKGNRQTECENQTFGKGTSAWSYVLACSFAKTDQGATGDSNQASKSPGSGNDQGSGVPNDPQCTNRLKEKVPDIKVLGRIENGSHSGTACIVPSGVRYRGKAVDFGSELTMDCSLAEKLEQFGDRMKGIGITRYTNMGAKSGCRGINNTNGINQSAVSSHGFGMAIDIDGFYQGGQLWNTHQYYSNAGVRSWLESTILPVACSTFKGVLGPKFYKGKWSHYHLEVKVNTKCDTTPR